MRSLLATAVAAFFAVPSAAQGALAVPCYEPALGANLALADDEVDVGRALGFAFPGPGGVTTTTIGVSSNGFVWLDGSANPGCCEGNATKFLSFGPRIAPLWLDLDPSAGGAVWFNTFPASGAVPARAVVTWELVPEYAGIAAVTCQLQLFADGSVQMYFDAANRIVNHPVLSGISAGNGAVGTVVDITATTASPFDSGTVATLYDLQWFDSDLAGSVWTFVPNGQGGYVVAPKVPCPFADARAFGQGCPPTATFHELFPAGGGFDLANTAIEFFPAAGGGYVAASVPGFFTGVTNRLLIGDEDLVGPIALPFVFAYPGGSTSILEVSSNGFVRLQPGSFDPGAFVSEPLFVLGLASIAPLWTNLDPSTASPSGGVFVDLVGSNEVHVTWLDVPDALGVPNTCQVTLRSDGSFRLAWGNVPVPVGDAIVGLSQGNGSIEEVEPSRDLSAGVFTTSGFGRPLRLQPRDGTRPQLGATFVMDVLQVPPASALGVMVFGTTGFPSGIDLTPFGMEQCALYATLDTLAPFALTGPSSTFALPVPFSLPLLGVSFVTQAATVSPGLTTLGLLSSNGLELHLGF